MGTSDPAGVAGLDRFPIPQRRPFRNAVPFAATSANNTVHAPCATIHAHAQVRLGRQGVGPVEGVLSERGIHRRATVRVSHFLGALHLVAASDLLLTVPLFPSALLPAALDLQAAPVPVALAPVVSGLAWPAPLHADPGHRWLRAQVGAVLEPRRP